MLIINWLRALYYHLFIDKMENKFPFGIYFFCGRQGAGKTISAVKYIKELQQKYSCLVFSNCEIEGIDGIITDLSNLFEIVENAGGANIVFFLDEVQTLFSCANSKNFDENILGFITQQRKNNVHIVVTSQVFTRVAKPLREQAFRVIDCKTYWGRCTVNKVYDAFDYLERIEASTEDKRLKVKCLWEESFFQTDKIRNLYNTYETIHMLGFTGKRKIKNGMVFDQIYD